MTSSTSARWPEVPKRSPADPRPSSGARRGGGRTPRPSPFYEEARLALECEEEVFDEELFGPAEGLHSMFRILRDELLDTVAGILYRADPMGVRLEGNTDEYEAEAATIIGRLPTASSAEDAAVIVREELARWYSDEAAPATPPPDTTYVEIGRKVWSTWQSKTTTTRR